jgi:hypothetical protein
LTVDIGNEGYEDHGDHDGGNYGNIDVEMGAFEDETEEVIPMKRSQRRRRGPSRYIADGMVSHLDPPVQSQRKAPSAGRHGRRRE